MFFTSDNTSSVFLGDAEILDSWLDFFEINKQRKTNVCWFWISSICRYLALVSTLIDLVFCLLSLVKEQSEIQTLVEMRFLLLLFDLKNDKKCRHKIGHGYFFFNDFFIYLPCKSNYWIPTAFIFLSKERNSCPKDLFF